MINQKIIYSIVENITKCKPENKSRKGKIVKSRQIYFYLCDKYLDLSLTKLGFSIGFEHHIVIYSIKSAKNKLLNNELLILCESLIQNYITGISEDKISLGLVYKYKVKTIQNEYDLKLRKVTKGMIRFEELFSLSDELVDKFIDTRIQPYLRFHQKFN